MSNDNIKKLHIKTAMWLRLIFWVFLNMFEIILLIMLEIFFRYTQIY